MIISPVLKIDEAAKYLGIKKAVLLLAIKRGQLPYIKLGRRLVMKKDLDTWQADAANVAQTLKAEQALGLSPAELAVKTKYENEGWRAYRYGEPDFLFIRKMPSGRVQGRFVEVKINGDRLSTRQKTYHSALRRLRLQVAIERPDGKAVKACRPNTKPRRKKGTGCLWLHGRVFWIKYYVDGRQVQESSNSADRSVAERLLARRLKSIRIGCPETGAERG